MGFHRFFLGLTWYDLILLGLTRFYWVLPGFTGFLLCSSGGIVIGAARGPFGAVVATEWSQLATILVHPAGTTLFCFVFFFHSTRSIVGADAVAHFIGRTDNGFGRIRFGTSRQFMAIGSKPAFIYCHHCIGNVYYLDWPNLSLK